MAIIYDDFIWQLSTEAPQPALLLTLPKDLQWVDEFNWAQVEQTTEFSLTGALLIQEGSKLKGRNITLSGLDNMAWITREQAETLLQMKNTPGLVITLRFVDRNVTSNIYKSFNVMFRHSEGAVEIKPIKQWDQFEPEAYCIINNIRFMETLAFGE